MTATARFAAGAAIVFVALASLASAQTAPGHGLGLEHRDSTCAPCRDFFQYANGAWVAKAVIPPAYSEYGASEELEDRTQAELHDLLEDESKHLRSLPAASNAQRLGFFYCSCMDSVRAESEGANPIEPQLGRIAEIATPAALTEELARLHSLGVPALFSAFVRQDPRNSSAYITWAYQGGLGLPDRDYYTRTDSASAAMRQAYVEHVGRMFKLIGDGEDLARPDAECVMRIETALARASMTVVQRQDPQATYHKMPLAQFQASCPKFDWADYLKGLGLPAIAEINVAQPDFYRGVDSLLVAVPLSEWRTYLRWKVANDAAPRLSSAYVDEDFRFRQRLTGAKVLLPRWKRCLAAADQALGEALGEEFVKRSFPPAAKARALEMVENLESTLQSRLGRLTWMSDSTRRQALEKLAAFHNKIGYPDRWRDYSSMSLGLFSYYQNAGEASRFDVHRRLARLGNPIDRNEWNMSPPTVNAYYNSGMNEIVFPAGILQPPFFFFDPAADDAVNYGATGATIGHEMTHGFDDRGRQFDADGNLRDWWTATDAKRFNERAERLVQQFNQYVAVDTLHINGKLTLGENIADLGGLVIAYEALEKSLEGKPRPLLDGLTPEQRFFIAYAQSWREIWRPELTRRLVLTDPHAPPRWRTNGAVENMSEFAKAFGCKAGDPMVRPDSTRAVIW